MSGKMLIQKKEEKMKRYVVIVAIWVTENNLEFANFLKVAKSYVYKIQMIPTNRNVIGTSNVLYSR